jgi:parallel beta-helix repeat protein
VVLVLVAAMAVVGLGAVDETAGAADGKTIIDGCTVIDESGSYALDGNVTDINNSQMIGGSDSRATCIDVRASDVIIDGNGHVFDSADPSSFSEQRGIRVNGTFGARENVTVRNVTATDWPRAVWVRNASGVTVENIDVRVRDGTVSAGQQGVVFGRFSSVSDSAVRNSTFEDYYSAIDGGSGDENITVRNNVVGGEIEAGGSNVVVTDNDVRAFSDASEGNVRVTGEGGMVSDNVVEDGNVEIEGANLTVAGNTVRNLTSTLFGMSILGSGHDVRNNTIEGNERGMTVGGSDHVLRDNAIRDNRENFHLGETFDDVGVLDVASLDIDTSNTAGGEPIRVFHGVTDRTFSNPDTGYLAYADSSGVTVRDIALRNNTDGLFLYNVTDATVGASTFGENGVGIEAVGGTDVTIRNTTVADNRRQGIVESAGRVRVSGLTVSNSTITGNGDSGVYSTGPGLRAIGNEITDNAEGIATSGDNATILDNNVSSNSGDGIDVAGSNVTVRDNVVSDNGGMGIFLDYTGTPGSPRTGPGNVVRNNTVTESGESGVVVNRNDVPVVGNALLGNDEAGIQIKTNGEGSVVRNNTARDNQYGVRLYHYESGLFDPELPISDTLLEDNVVTGNDEGISVGTRSANNTIRDNVATGNGVGIHLENVGENRILDNNASANAGDGIRLEDYYAPFDPQRVPILNNTALGNGDDGIELANARPGDTADPSGPFVIRDNAVGGNSDDGILVDDARNVTVADNGRIHGNDDAGIRIEDSTNVSVQNHTVAGNGGGFLALSSEFTVTNLNASGNDGDGISIDDVADLSLGADVTASDNGGSGIDIEDGRDVRIREVPTIDNGLDGISFVDTEDALIRNVTTTDNHAAGIEVVDDDFTQEENVTVRNTTIRRNGVGIWVEGVERTIIADSTITDGNASAAVAVADINVPANGPEDRIRVNGSGVVLESASNATLLDNEITENDGKGIVATLSADGSRVAGNDVTDNGGNGIELVEASGPLTIANNVVSDNGGLELYDTLSIGPNGKNGVYLESSSNATVRNNTIEGNEEHGVRIRDESNDNRIVGNAISSHETANATGHGVFIEGLGVSFGSPSNNTVVDNAITDNDYGVSMFHDLDTVVRGNDVLRNGIGVRFGSNTEPISSRETTECTDGGVLAVDNQFGGSTDGTVVGNEIRTNGTALKIVTHPSQTTTCDGTTTDIDYDDPTVEGYLIANNYIEGSDPINATNTRLDYPTGETYDSSFNGTNAWNVSKTVAGNVLGGPNRAGNYWATPDGTGFSQTCTDADDDGICDSPRPVATNNVDELPLATGQPAFFDVVIDSTTSPGVSADEVDVTATITNTGDATATKTIDLTVNGTIAGSVTRTLDPGGSTTETFTWDTTGISPGAYTATVASETDSEMVPVTIQPNVSVSIDATNTPVTETQTLAVEATVRNNREAAFTETIELLDVGGVVVDSREVNLGAGESAPITLSWPTAVGEEGTGDVTVRSPNDAANETVTVRNGTITDCTVISRPGVYRLESDLAFSGDECLVVESSDVIINGGGHEIVGSGDGTGVLIDVADGASGDVAVNNLTVRDVSDVIEVPVPDQGAVSGISVTGVTAESVGDDALYSEVGENGTVAGLSVQDSDFTTDDDGVVLDVDDVDATVRDVRVTGTTLNTSDIGVGLYLDYERTTLDGFELANSTIEASGEAVDLDASDVNTAVRNIRIADSTLNASNTAVAFDYAGDDATFESVRIADSRIRGSLGVSLVGTDAGVHTRGIDIRGNDIAVDEDYSAVVVFDVAGDGAVLENATVAENSLAGDAIQGGTGITLDPSGGIDDHAVVRSTAIRNNSIRSVGGGLDVSFFGDPGAHELNVTGNDITNVTNNGISLDATLDPGSEIRIRENRIESATGASADGLTIDPESFDSSGSGTLSVRRNVFRTDRDALVLQSGPVDTISIAYNVFDADRFGVRNVNDAEPGSVGRDRVNATMNYWAASDGPGSAGPYADPVTGALADGSGSAVSNGSSATVSNVRFDPFLTTDPTDSGGSDQPAFFETTILETNSPVTNGSVFEVTAEVENTGDVSGTREVTLALPGVVNNQTTVSLGAGETTNVTLALSTESVDAGNYTVFLDTEDVAVETDMNVTDTVSVARAVAGSDGIIDLSEIQSAINLWAEDDPVPGTNGQTISLTKIQELINLWAEDTPVPG